MIEIPERLQWIADFPGGSEWLERLPRLVEEATREWSLQLEEPYEYANVSLAAPAGDVVLKVGFPHWESEHEAAALAHWGGNGAVRLLAHDVERNALLLERCVPGTSLLELPEQEGYRHAAEVKRKLGERAAPPGHPFIPIADTAVRWAGELPERFEMAGQPFERELLDAAVSALVELPPTQGELVVCHQDFHRGNVLAAEREPWLAIDPKPVVAEREFDTAALIRDGPRRPRLAARLPRLGARARPRADASLGDRAHPRLGLLRGGTACLRESHRCRAQPAPSVAPPRLGKRRALA